jgi:hypothetical protein
VVTPAEPFPLPPGEKGKAPMPTPPPPVMVAAEEDDEEEEDQQPLSRRPRQPPGKILGQGTSGDKREGEVIDALAAPLPKRRRSTAGRAPTRQAAGLPSDSEETASDREVLADPSMIEAEGGEAALDGGDKVPAVVSPDPPAGRDPSPETMKAAAPEPGPTVPAEVAGTAGPKGKTPLKRYKPFTLKKTTT